MDTTTMVVRVFGLAGLVSAAACLIIYGTTAIYWILLYRYLKSNDVAGWDLLHPRNEVGGAGNRSDRLIYYLYSEIDDEIDFVRRYKLAVRLFIRCSVIASLGLVVVALLCSFQLIRY